MMIYSAEYTEVVEKRVAHTISALRQMRCGGENAQQHSEAIPSTQEVLMDAEKLAKSAVPYLVHFLIKAHTSEMLQQWEEALAEMRTKYHRFPQIRRSPFSMPLMEVRTYLTAMSIPTNFDGLTRCTITGHNIADMEFADLFDDSLGILAPLSTDVLIASLLPEFILLHHSKRAPQVKPALLSTDLETCTLPRNESGEPVFTAMSRVLAFVDQDGMTSTRKALTSAANLEYPGKVIPTGSHYRYSTKLDFS